MRWMCWSMRCDVWVLRTSCRWSRMCDRRRVVCGGSAASWTLFIVQLPGCVVAALHTLLGAYHFHPGSTTMRLLHYCT